MGHSSKEIQYRSDDPRDRECRRSDCEIGGNRSSVERCETQRWRNAFVVPRFVVEYFALAGGRALERSGRASDRRFAGND
jgi:hypothetical protein